MTYILSLSLLIVALASPADLPQGPPSLADVMQPGECRLEFDEETTRWRFRIHIPPRLEKENLYPLVIWLHGEGQSGSDNSRQIRHLEETLLTTARREEGCQMFILAPQKPRGVPWYGSPAPSSAHASVVPDMLDVVMNMAQKVAKEHPVDSSRIIVMGLSSGAAATWELGARHPEAFAAVLPFAAGPSGNSDVASLANVPVWAFHSPVDAIASPEPSEQAVQKLKSLGGSATFTLSADFPDAADGLPSHSCWASAFRDYRLYEWLLAQGQGVDNPFPPGRAPTDFTSYLKALGAATFAAVILVACWSEIRRRQNTSIEQAELPRVQW